MFDLAKELGLSPFATWWRVASPQVRPTAAAVGALALPRRLQEFLKVQLIYGYDERWFTLPLGLRSLSTLIHEPAPHACRRAPCMCAAGGDFATVQGRLVVGPPTSKESR